MNRISTFLLALALNCGLAMLAHGADSAFNTTAGSVGQGSLAEVNGENTSHSGRPLAMGPQQVALWQEEPILAPPATQVVAASMPPRPTVDLQVVERPLPAQTPLPAQAPLLAQTQLPAQTPLLAQAQPEPPISGIPPGLAPLPQVNAEPGGNLPPIQAEVPAPVKENAAVKEKENAPNQPFTIMSPNRVAVLTVAKGRSELLRSKVEFSRTAVVDPKVCDLLQYSPTELGFIGKDVGTTEVTVWFRDSNDPNIDTQPRSFVVHVVPENPEGDPHLKQLEAEIARLFPNSKVRLRTFGRRIIVLGQARDVAEAGEILNFVRGEQIDADGKWVSGPTNPTGEGGPATDNVAAGNSFARSNNPQGRNANANWWNYHNQNSDRVINMLKVPGVHQIMLRVKIAELDRTAARNFGANFSTAIQFRNGTLLLQSLLNASNSNSVIGTFSNNQLNFGISYLEQHGVVRLLSEPTLMTMSGKTANMVAGGEFAVPTTVGVQGVSAVSTNFVAYGAIISFTPYLLDKDLIRLNVSPEFSQIDAGTTVNGIPGLTTRSVTTTVELRAGQTLALAGLLSDSMTSNTQSDWPWIGKLIGPRSVSRSETELIVLVTPELVQPMEPDEVPPMPGFDVTEPDNIQFILRGDIEGNPTRDYRSTVWPMLEQRYRAGGSPMISGPFGHSNSALTGDPSTCPK